MSKDEIMDYFVVLINDINNEFRANVEHVKKYKKEDVLHTMRRLRDFEKKFEAYKDDPYFEELAGDLVILNFECWILSMDTEDIFKALGA